MKKKKDPTAGPFLTKMVVGITYRWIWTFHSTFQSLDLRFIVRHIVLIHKKIGYRLGILGIIKT